MIGVRRLHFLKWVVVICSLLFPLTVMAGTNMSQPGSSQCGMAAHHCDCCQQPGSRHCRTSHSSCACPGLPCLTATYSGLEAEAVAPYQPVMAKPAAKIFIPPIFHPPEKLLLFSL